MHVTALCLNHCQYKLAKRFCICMQEKFLVNIFILSYCISVVINDFVKYFELALR